MSPGCAECWVFPLAAIMRGVSVIRHGERSKMPSYLNALELYTPRAVASTALLVSTPSYVVNSRSSALASVLLGLCVKRV